MIGKPRANIFRDRISIAKIVKNNVSKTTEKKSKLNKTFLVFDNNTPNINLKKNLRKTFAEKYIQVQNDLFSNSHMKDSPESNITKQKER